MNSTTRPRAQFWVAAAIFLGPFFAAFAIYHWFPEWLPNGRTNYGQMIDPPRPLPAVSLVAADGKPVDSAELHRHWNLIYLGADACDPACRDRMHFGRQLWLALNEKRVKLQRYYIASSPSALVDAQGALSADSADVRWLAGGESLRQFVQPTSPQALYLVDPFGNWIMTYVPTANADGVQKDFKGMQKDLNKLLKL
jgi:hypothetical protein